MKRITIYDVDQTTNQATTINSDVVYVPGFAVKSLDSRKGKYVPESLQPARQPKLCTSVAEFESLFGSSAATFLVDQVYPEYSSGHAGFMSQAIPSNTGQAGLNTWFNSGSPDPSYAYAKELLSMGIPVLYERVNEQDIAPSFTFEITTFNPTKKYVVDDHVVYEEHYYVCVDPCGPGVFNVSDWALMDEDGTVYAMYDTQKTYAVGAGCSRAIEAATVDQAVVGVSAVGAGGFKYYKCIAPTTGTFNEEKWQEIDISAMTFYDVNVETMYAAMTDANGIYYAGSAVDPVLPRSLGDVSSFDVKYITSGGYPTFEYKEANGAGLYQRLVTLAATRGDAIAFIDHTDCPNRPLVDEGSVFDSLQNLPISNGEYATMITPYGRYGTTAAAEILLPGSFGYLVALARSLKSNYSWLPVAGIVRGFIPNLTALDTQEPLTNSVADYYQTAMDKLGSAACINAITNIRDQGYTLWGNRTMYKIADNSPGFASSFLNMRNLICDVKKRAYTAAQKCLFEQNTDILWVNFTSDVMGLLDQMVSGNVIKYYKILKVATTDKTKLAAKIQIAPIYAVETVEITIVLTDEDAIVE